MIKFCSLFSGSSGNAIFIGTEKTKLLVDAGLSCKRIIEALVSIGENPWELSAILVTHEHSDHIRGAGIISRKFGIPIYANEGTWNEMKQAIGPVNGDKMHCFNTDCEFEIGPIGVKPFPIPHDASDPVGFNFFSGNKKVTIATDIGHMNKELSENLEKSDLLLLESNHDVEMLRIGPYPWWLKKRILSDKGHLSNEMAGETIACMAEKGTRNFMLGHLSRENNFPELAYQTVKNALHDRQIKAGEDVFLNVVTRNHRGDIVEL